MTAASTNYEQTGVAFCSHLQQFGSDLTFPYYGFVLDTLKKVETQLVRHRILHVRSGLPKRLCHQFGGNGFVNIRWDNMHYIKRGTMPARNSGGMPKDTNRMIGEVRRSDYIAQCNTRIGCLFFR